MRASCRFVAPLDRRDAAVAHEHRVVGLGMHLRIVRRKHEGHVLLALHRAHQRDDRRAGLAVEVGGRLVGQHQLRRGRQCARDGDALALAAGQLAGTVVAPGRPVRPRPAALAPARAAFRRHAGQQQRIFDVLVRVSTGSRLKFWKMKPRWRARKSDKASSLSCCTGFPATIDLALVGPVDAADQVEQRRLAAARRAGDHGEAVRPDFQVDIGERRNIDRIEVIGLADML